jgi:hypothetical protein
MTEGLLDNLYCQSVRWWIPIQHAKQVEQAQISMTASLLLYCCSPQTDTWWCVAGIPLYMPGSHLQLRSRKLLPTHHVANQAIASMPYS